MLNRGAHGKKSYTCNQNSAHCTVQKCFFKLLNLETKMSHRAKGRGSDNYSKVIRIPLKRIEGKIALTFFRRDPSTDAI
jgi:hypothetical protein